MIKLLLLLLAVAWGQVLNMSDPVMVEYRKCREERPTEVTRFESEQGFPLYLAMKNLKGVDQKNGDRRVAATDACAIALGAEYGRILFESDPKGANIYMDGEIQERRTNVALAFSPGSYAYRIERQDAPACEGNVRVVANRKTVIRCPTK